MTSGAAPSLPQQGQGHNYFYRDELGEQQQQHTADASAYPPQAYPQELAYAAGASQPYW
jgi:hypothetical protein